tara:strand:+ start:770 stop:1102 length:333 start_codon:yes stop_codon:yes gene_type:complete
MITLSENAIAKFDGALDPTDYVRIGVISGGCSGLSYSLTVEEKEDKRENDVVVGFGNIKVCMDPFSAEILSETTLDYVETMASSGFKFNNSKAEGTCGCGTSFSQQGCTK